MAGPLAGIRVLEFSQIVAGPVAGVNLSDLGADVVKVEPPDGDSHRRLGAIVPNESKNFQGLNRGKRSLVVDLHDPAGRELVHRLVRDFDVVIINYRHGVAERLGIDYETLRQLRPDLIYWQNTGFGERGPHASRAGSDIVAQAYSGLMVTDGKRDDDGAPSLISIPIADFTAGFAAAMGVCAALYHRERTGEGQYLHTSLLHAGLFLQVRQVMREPVHDATQRDPAMEEVTRLREEGAPYDELLAARQGRRSYAASFTLYYGGYLARDGAVVVGALTKANRDAMRRVLGFEDERSDDPDYDAADPESVAKARDWKRIFREKFLERTVDEWLAVFDAAGVPVAPVQMPEELADDPQVESQGIMVDLVHSVTGSQRVVGPVLSMSATPSQARRAAPALGEHTEEVLIEHGLEPGEVAKLIEARVVRGWL